MLDILGLAAAIEWHAGEFQQRTGIKCRLNIGESDLELDDKYAIDFYRIMQEALTNVSLHASASRVSIYLKQEDGKLIMRIKDNGKGIPAEKLNNSRSFGLIGMRERAKSIGGTLEIKSSPGSGTMVKLSVQTK